MRTSAIIRKNVPRRTILIVTYGLIEADSKAQTVAEMHWLFTRRLCAAAALCGFLKKIGHALDNGSGQQHRSAVAAIRHCGKRCGRPWGRPAAREPGLGTGRGGDVTELAYLLGSFRSSALRRCGGRRAARFAERDPDI